MHYHEWDNPYSPVIKARYVRDYTVWLRFADGTEGEIDLGPELSAPCFEMLKDIEFFKQFYVDGDTLKWPNDEDFAPEFLYWSVIDSLSSPRPV